MASNLYTHQDANARKTWFLMTTFFLVVIGLGWFFSYYFDAQIILIIAVFFSIIMNVGAYWFSDKLVLRIAGAHEISRESHRELFNIVENLSITAGLPTPKIYVLDDSVPNAFATGRDKEHAVVAVSTGLLHLLDRSELEGVIAHELAHIGNRDMLVSTVVVVLVGFITLLSDIFLRSMVFGGDNDNKAGGWLALVGLALAILSPIIATLIRMAISRKREFLADATGALLTRYPEGLASALEKIGRYSGKMRRANHATAHLFFSNPFGAGRMRNALDKMFSTHPPIEDRIKALRGL